MGVSTRFAMVGLLPGQVVEAMAVLDAMTGNRTTTMQLLQGTHRPGAGLFGPADMAARPVQLAQAGGTAAPTPQPIPRPGMDPEARRALGQAGGGAALGSAVIGAAEAMRQARDRTDGETTQQAFDTFQLDRTNLADVFAAGPMPGRNGMGPGLISGTSITILGFPVQSTRRSRRR